MKTLLLAGVAFLLSAAPSLGAPASDRECFRNRDVSGYSLVNDNTLRVRVSPSRSYDLTTAGGDLRDLRWNFRIALRSDSDWICTGNGLGTSIRQLNEFHRSWYISNIARAPSLQQQHG